MRKVFGIILIGLGIVTLLRGGDIYHTLPGTIGGLIAVTGLCFLPAYFLLRKKKKFHENDNIKKGDNE